MIERGIVVIGGGPAGLAAAVAARRAGAKDVLLLDREKALGGILKQCIHNGFGLHTFKEELTGPEYAQRYIEMANAEGVEAWTGTMVIGLTGDRVITAVSRERGLVNIHAGAVVLAMGCRERPRGSIGTPGWRCAGIYTAGTAQRFVNLEGYMPGNRVVILGSGDIGLIMARRMTFMGAKVECCVELMPYSSGLRRNIVQCLDDYGIPLYLSHTVTEIHGRERLTGVTIAGVDDKLAPVPGTEKLIECDTLLLSVGLIPENELSRMASVEIAGPTGGPVVDDRLETSADGIFACGNVLHVHDLVDNVSAEAEEAGRSAFEYISGARGKRPDELHVTMGSGVNGIVPQLIARGATEPVKLMFRPRAVLSPARIRVKAGGELIFERKARVLAPGEMASLTLTPDVLKKAAGADAIEVSAEVDDNDKA